MPCVQERWCTDACVSATLSPLVHLVAWECRWCMALDMVGKLGVGFRRFRGSPGRPGEVGKMRAAEDHRTNGSCAPHQARTATSGSWRHRIPQQFISRPGSPAVLIPHSGSSADDHPAQPYPILPPRPPELLDRVHDALRTRPHNIGARPSTVHRPAQRCCASRGLTGIAHSTPLKQKGTQGSNVPDEILTRLAEGSLRSR